MMLPTFFRILRGLGLIYLWCLLIPTLVGEPPNTLRGIFGLVVPEAATIYEYGGAGWLTLALRSLWTLLAAALAAYPVGILLGVICGRKRWGKRGWIVEIPLRALSSLPVLGLALVAFYWLTMREQIPTPGLRAAGTGGWHWGWGFLLGAVVIAPPWAAAVAREVFAEISRQRGSRRIAYARSFGMSEGAIHIRHLVPFGLALAVRRLPGHLGLQAGWVCLAEFALRLSGLGGTTVRAAMGGEIAPALSLLAWVGLGTFLLRSIGHAGHVSSRFSNRQAWGVAAPKAIQDWKPELLMAGILGFFLILLLPLSANLFGASAGADTLIAGKSILPPYSVGDEARPFSKILLSASLATLGSCFLAALFAIFMGAVVSSFCLLFPRFGEKLLLPILVAASSLPPLLVLLVVGAGVGGVALILWLGGLAGLVLARDACRTLLETQGSDRYRSALASGVHPLRARFSHALDPLLGTLGRWALRLLPPLVLLESAARFLWPGSHSLGSLARFGWIAIFDEPSVALAPALLVAPLCFACYLLFMILQQSRPSVGAANDIQPR